MKSVPLYPLWLAMWMHVDPDFRDYLQCLHENAPYWSEGKKFWPGNVVNCRPLRLDNIGFYVQVFLGAVGTGLVWLAGWLASGRPMVAHLSAFFAVYAGSWLILGISTGPKSSSSLFSPVSTSASRGWSCPESGGEGG